MQAIIDFFSKPFVWGLCLGLLFFAFSAWGHFKTARELRRYRKHLSDKLELEARQYETLRREKEQLTRENENLRLRIAQLNEKPDHRIARDFEVLCRAEKRMTVQAPGFAAAWESAKAAALEEMTIEDQGGSLPKRILTRLFGTGAAAREGDPRALPEHFTATAAPHAPADSAPNGDDPAAPADPNPAKPADSN